MKSNTVEKALSVMASKIGHNSNEYRRILGLVNSCESWAEEVELTGRQTELLLMSACFLNVGKHTGLDNHNFNPVDGYNYLKLNRWDVEVCLLVLHQTNAKCMAKPTSFNCDELYSQPLPDNLKVLYKILTLVDFTTNELGEKVTIDERVNELENKLGINSTESIHAVDLSYEVAAWALDLRFQK